MFTLLWAKAWKFVVGIGVLLAAVAAIFLKGRSDGKKVDQAEVQEVTVKAAVAAANTEQVESRDAEDQALDKQATHPAAPQTVATADPASAAGQLNSGGWTEP